MGLQPRSPGHPGTRILLYETDTRTLLFSATDQEIILPALHFLHVYFVFTPFSRHPLNPFFEVDILGGIEWRAQSFSREGDHMNGRPRQQLNYSIFVISNHPNTVVFCVLILLYLCLSASLSSL